MTAFAVITRRGEFMNGYRQGFLWAAAGMAGLAVGAMAGSAAAKSQQQSSYASQSYPPPSAAQPMAITSPLPMGTRLSSLPPGRTSAVVKSVEYHGRGPTGSSRSSAAGFITS